MGVASNTGTIPTEKGMIVCNGVAEKIAVTFNQHIVKAYPPCWARGHMKEEM